MKNKLFTVVLLLSAICGSVNSLSAGGESEGQRAKRAEKLFLAKDYEKAAPLFAQLVSSNPKSYKYNYYYGICLTIIGKDKSEALPYLEKALQHPKTPEEIYYYLGRTLHYTYQFDNAIRAFTEFNTIIGARNAPRWGTSQLMEMCNNAKQYLDTTRLSLIQERTESSAYDFYTKYEFENANGKLLSMPDDILESTKSNKEERPTIFLSSNGRVMYYSARSDETNSRDIYRMEKDLDGNWTPAVRIEKMVNTQQDELFPTCNSDGRILYFSSRGHSSTGGFDIFKCYYNTISKTWTMPENMGSPYNSPDDDFCFLSSTAEQKAYFTSQRETKPGVFTVYKVPYANTEELPVAINGRFNCVGEPDLKQIRLLITRDGAENIVADLMTDAKTGAYAVELPGPGTYSFTVEAAGFNPHTEQVRFGEFSDRIYIQDIFLSRAVNGIEDMAISNRRLTESGFIDENMTAMEEDDGSGMTTFSGTFSEAEIAAMKMSGITPETVASNRLKAKEVEPVEAGPATNEPIRLNKTEMSPSVLMGEISFKVQIGAFRKHTRELVTKRLEKKTDKTMLTSYDDLTWLRFFLGTEATYQSAKNLRDTLQQAGFKDAFVVAFRDSKPMNLYEAIQTCKKQEKKN